MAIYRAKGIPFVRFPVTGADDVNNQKRNIQQKTGISVQHAMSDCGASAEQPVLFLGSIRNGVRCGMQIAASLGMNYVIAVSNGQRDYFRHIGMETDWTQDGMLQQLPEGNGILFLPTDIITKLAVSEAMQNGDWSDHYVILAAGTGLAMDSAMMNAVSGIQRCTVATDNLQTSRIGEVNAEYILDLCSFWVVEKAGGGAELISRKLPQIDREKVTNSMNFSRSGGRTARMGRHHESTWNLGQTRTVEESSILTAEQIRKINASGRTLLYSVSSGSREVCYLEF